MLRLSRTTVAAAFIAFGAPGDALADGDAARGKTLFSRCSGCYTITNENKVGPHLSGVFRRTAGTVPGARYSKAMTSSGIVWNDETLDAFLATPSKAPPGTAKPISVPNAQDRADIIAYLKTVTQP